MLKMDPFGSLIFRLCGSSMVVMRSVGGMYGTGGQLLSCPLSHLESFNLLGSLRVVLILACCQSVVLSTSLLKEDFGRTHRNRADCVVARKKLCRMQSSRSPNFLLVPTLHVQPIGWPGTEKNWPLQYALLDESRVLNSKCPKRSAK